MFPITFVPRLRWSSRIIGSAVALALAASFVPAVALGAQSSEAQNVVDTIAESNSQAIELVLETGSINGLHDYNAYSSNNTNSILSRSTLPETFDLRALGLVTSVKLQNPFGTCWAFGAIAACETSLMSQLGYSTFDGQSIDLSELHLAWFAYTPLPDDAADSQGGEGSHPVDSSTSAGVLQQGGTVYTSTSLFSSGIGPMDEATVPYQNKDLEDYPPVYRDGVLFSYNPEGDWSVDESLHFSTVVELQESSILPSPAGRTGDTLTEYLYNEEGTQAIKEELLAGRAVEICFCADTSKPDQEGPSQYINLDTWAHYTNNTAAAVNHAVTIVGWDDTYSKDNFASNTELGDATPPADGAWIVKNSWGSVDEEFPNYNTWGEDGSGYFYLSYYDQSIETPETFSFNIDRLADEDTYFYINQYDYMPSSGLEVASSEAQVGMANVFTAEDDMVIRSLSCETAVPDVEVTYELYLLDEGFTNPQDGTLLTEVVEAYEYGGYHRVELDQGFQLEEGQQYSVVVTEEAQGVYQSVFDGGLNEYGLDTLLELQPEYSGLINSYSEGVVNEGESFFYEVQTDGSVVWTDLTTIIESLQTPSATNPQADWFDYDNYPIKAYANPAPVVTAGDGQSAEAGEEISFTTDIPNSQFSKVLVDGVELSSENYSVSEDDVTITLLAPYTSTLDEVQYSISIVSTLGGHADATFIITAAQPEPSPAPDPEPQPDPSPSPDADSQSGSDSSTGADSQSESDSSSDGDVTPTTGDALSSVVVVVGVVMILAGGVIVVYLVRRRNAAKVFVDTEFRNSIF